MRENGKNRGNVKKKGGINLPCCHFMKALVVYLSFGLSRTVCINVPLWLRKDSINNKEEEINHDEYTFFACHSD